MANNFSQADTTLANNNLTTVVSTTSNKQIVIGLLISNTGTSAINVTAKLNNGSADRSIITNAPLPTGASIECIQGKLVIPSGGSIKVQKDGGTADVIVSLLTDVT
jgi:archaellum component FlaF (FlaF/FlaG flagellin family)